MEVRPGYKQSEVGIIPDDWEVKSVANLGAIKTGPFGTLLKASEYSGTEGVPLISVGEVGAGTFKIKEHTPRIPEKVVGRLPEYVLRTGDIVFGRKGAVERSALVTEHENGWFLGSDGISVRPNGLCYPPYLSCQFQRQEVQGWLRQHAIGTTMPSLNQEILNRVQVPCAPLPEQRAIATALSDVDALLGALDRLIAKKRDLKQAAMQQLLTGQTRLPGFHGQWEVKTLFELAERKKELFDDGDWIESEHITTEGIRLIQTGNIGVGNFVEKDSKKYIFEKSFSTLRCKPLMQGDLLVCRLADPAGRACVLPDIGEDRIVTSVDVTIFRPPHEVADRIFLSNVFSTSEWFRDVSDRSGGTTHKRISRGALGRIRIKLPPVTEQTAIAEVLSDMDAEIAALEQRREKTRALKQGMMQELLTGRVRLTNGEGRIENGE